MISLVNNDKFIFYIDKNGKRTFCILLIQENKWIVDCTGDFKTVKKKYAYDNIAEYKVDCANDDYLFHSVFDRQWMIDIENASSINSIFEYFDIEVEIEIWDKLLISSVDKNIKVICEFIKNYRIKNCGNRLDIYGKDIELTSYKQKIYEIEVLTDYLLNFPKMHTDICRNKYVINVKTH